MDFITDEGKFNMTAENLNHIKESKAGYNVIREGDSMFVVCMCCGRAMAMKRA